MLAIRLCFIPGDILDICCSNNDGFNKNSNHKIVSGDIGTVPGRNKSTSIIVYPIYSSR